MKTSITKLFCLLFLSLSFSSHAQMLEEIPNPPGNFLNWFSGGEDGNLFFEYIDPNFNPTLFHYDEVDLSQIPLPTDLAFSFYSHQYAGNSYVVVYDNNFIAQLYEYDGTTAEVLDIPAGFQFGNYATTYNDLMYLNLFDANFNSIFYQYDGTDLLEVPSPDGLQFNNYVTTFDGLMFVNYFDPITFFSQMYTFDGNVLTPLSGIPDDASFVFLAADTEDVLYFGVQDGAFNTSLYAYDGTDFTNIPTPDGLNFSFIAGQNDEAGEVYINYFDDITFSSLLYIYNGADLIPIALPPNFDFPGVANVFNGVTYLSLFDNISFNGALFKLDSSTGILDQVIATPAASYSFFTETLLGEAYYIFYDNDFNNKLYKLDEATNTVNEIPAPDGDWQFSNFATVSNDKMFMSYYNSNFNQTFFMYDGAAYTEIENPAGLFYDFFMTEDNGMLYLRYMDVNFNGTLYKLTPNSLPTSEDNSVTTYINIPYFFESTDFTFADPDLDDSLNFIMVTEVEQVGYLLLDGAHIYEGDIIPVSEIENMTFTPLTDEEGNPYDAFSFRVGDGDAFSDLSYVMQINVVDQSTAVIDNELNAMTSVFPVPANNFTNLSVNANTALGGMTLRIFNANGQAVFQKQFDGLGNNFQERIDLSHFATGTYFILGRTDAGQFVKPLLVKR